jgi:hypothetical protein
MTANKICLHHPIKTNDMFMHFHYYYDYEKKKKNVKIKITKQIRKLCSNRKTHYFMTIYMENQ